MSLRSMTGYGRGQAAVGGISATVEISAVNRKQLDIQCSLPRGMSALEVRVLEAIQSQVARGRLSIDVTIDWAGVARRKAVRLDEPLAAAYLEALRSGARSLNIKDDIGMKALIQLPDVIQLARPQEDLERAWKPIERALRLALKDFSAMRAREGRVLQQDLVKRIGLLEKLVKAITARAPAVTRNYRKKLHARLKQAGFDALADDDRVLREIALFADRCDITEELTRLESHLEQARRMTRARAATGRSLDFLAQELFREINTVGSKANDSVILQRVVEFKTELERIREQVQNIE